jgi:succinate dehydrogenase / fumarate reductase cytochrome b subunit
VKKQQRPVFLNPLKIAFPASAKVSILHRFSGLLLFLAIPVGLALLQRSLSSADALNRLADIAGYGVALKSLLLIVLVGTAYHFCAGIRFLLLDMHVGVALGQARRSAKLVLAAGVVAFLVFGFLLW